MLAILAAALLTNPRSVVKLSEIEELSVALPSGDAAENMDRVIFHDWFGMFVYDIEVKQFVGAVDLAQIGCGV